MAGAQGVLAMAFGRQYHDWRIKRIPAIVEHYGAAFFWRCRQLGSGAGYGDFNGGI